MERIVQSISNIFTGGSQGGKTSTDKEIAPHAAKAQSTGEAAGAKSGKTAGKTAREDAGGEGAERPVKRRTSSIEHERRLTGHFYTPTTATAISVPTYENPYVPREPPKASSTRMGGAFKPVNTLHATPHAAGRGQGAGQRAGTPYAKAAPRGAPAKRLLAKIQQGTTIAEELRLVESRAGNVQDPAREYDLVGDSFNDRPNGVKRRKTGHPNGANMKVIGETVDLTDGDDEETSILNAKVKSVNGKEVHDFRKPTAPAQKPRAGSRAAAEEDAFSCNYVTTMNKTLYQPPPKPRREKGDSQAPSRSSQQPRTRSPSVVSQAHEQPATTQPGSRQSPVQVDKSEGSVRSASQQKVPRKGQRRTIPQTDPGPSGTSNRPPIDLERGFDEIGKAPVRAGSTRDSHISGNSLLRQKQGRPSEERIIPRQVHNVLKAGNQKSGALSGKTLGAAAQSIRQQQQQQKRPASPPLAQRFQRDELTISQTQPQTKKIKRTAAMQAESTRFRPQPNTSSVDDSMDSIDPLQGEPTVPSKAGRSVSPVKIAPTKDRAASPSDLKPTNFRTSSTADSARQKAQDFSDVSEEYDDIDSNTMPIQAFYAAAYCASESGSDKVLIYNKDTEELDLHVAGEAARFGEARPVSLSATNVRRIHHVPGSGHVFLKGSALGVSNGAMCVAFNDYDGVSWFVTMMLGLSRLELAPAVSRWAPEQMEKTFGVQTRVLQDAFIAKRNVPPSGLYKEARRRADSIDDNDDEQIRYEPNEQEEEKRPSRRKAMQGGEKDDIHTVQRNIKQQRQTALASAYFQNSSAVRRSTRERKPVVERPRTPTPERWTQTHGLPPWQKPVEYPVKGVRRVTVDVKDLEWLDEGQFLNDNIISFGLRKIEEEMKPEHRDQVHFFNSFFYTSLSTKNGKKVFNYEGVKKWTKNKDLFAMPFVVVPINIDLHWILAIVCNLDRMGKESVAGASGAPVAAAGSDEQEDESLVVVGEDDTTLPAKGESAMKRLSLSDNDEDEVRSDVFDYGEDDKIASQDGEGDPTTSRPGTAAMKGKKGGKGKHKSVPPVKTFPADAPTIILLDSFGNNHPRESNNLKEYVAAEAKDKRDLDLDPKDIQGVNAKGLPQQSNFCDCGVFLIGYVEAFAADPRGFVERIMARKMDKADDFKGYSPVSKRAGMREDLIKLYTKQEEARRGFKKAKAHAGVAKVGEPSTTSSAGPASTAATPNETPTVSKASTPAREQGKPVVIAKPSQAAASTSKESTPAPQAVRQKTPLPLKSKSPVRRATGKHSTRDHEDDYLEVGAPRPLQPQRTAPVTNKQGAEFNGSVSSADDDDDNDHDDYNDNDMLDNGSAPKTAASAAPDTTTERDILSSLEHQLHEDEEAVAWQKVKGSMEEAPRDRQRSPSKLRREQPAVVVVEDDSQRSAVVPDSQEGGSVVWQGTKTVFSD
ncbi:hypothetical protein LTR78_000013 [Recurvomyces mirabilis]|uniref:Ubiquitin-like protease family profile domain-containing protein n=1 Tax=Recurvomyces mirabilis TaxID=574656 RepID=A0AAE1C655_9PEZI|nr:hypothetical protein LTR78_000013 [Recurvomyces mirabilis]KAK5161670.1 hypothetical protein LTS14_000014 [Recurvomyces mirabilis]